MLHLLHQESEGAPGTGGRLREHVKEVGRVGLAERAAQDRLAEKRFVERLGGRPAPYAAVNSPAELEDAVARLGAPGILKTRRDGYDGKGQWRIDKGQDLPQVAIPQSGLIYEGLVDFTCEFSVIMARATTSRPARSLAFGA